MSYVVTVLYPHREGATFDHKYYLDKHMPLVDRHWKPAGLQKWEIVDFDFSADGKAPQFSVAAVLTWKDEESSKAALAGPGGAEIVGDIVKFSSEQPIIIAGRLAATG
ncbi:hypothetical protein ACRE_076430 [Hapsidospora chrysogenum ATCC 11550]|uniref:EthD domain-containing protein n=1 Tax=Hapsidospora chrysogenum (strain ATCC 11550 / CBS 779.69 / DSM 880 / IAM 14645 / JCM 23072 / IMI 49137) TaxID=857340 RepID=A0A086SX06_HAPC1|nr:hypothetical protein ACRE_076430 [Hapsidospora chrysogenum ATCC 11550]